MKNVYECYHCEKVSDEDQWNSSTQVYYKETEIVSLNNNTDLYSASFICPNCSEVNDGWTMRKVDA